MILFIFFSFLTLAQTNSALLDEEVSGIIITDQGSYLILQKGFIQINKNDIYTEYYRQIYKDSTLVSPNTELKDDFSLTIIPYLVPSTFNDRIDFSEPINLGIFLQLNKSGEYEFTSFGEAYVDSIISK